MYWFDVVIGAAFLIAAVWSFFRGLTREVLALLSLTAAVMLAAQGYPHLIAELLAGVIRRPWLRQLLGFAALVVSTLVLYLLFSWLLGRLVRAAGLSLLDRLLGGLFGLLKMAVMLSAFLVFTTAFLPSFTTTLAQRSALAPPFFRTAALLASLLPAQIYDDFHRLYGQLRQRLGSRLPPLAPPPPLQVPPPRTPASPPSAPEGISESDRQAFERLLRQRLGQP
ncbi:MAG: hypothetical protein KatS3mg131_2504 [Candidatus Tectimicrobiota bacterium]|nr:MAG: hypothetical protein KatS3mg131_2504 [Candidatus Tectomicrobia bacterium]